MGHVEPGGTAANQEAVVGELAVWSVWRRLKTYFPTWSLLPSSVYTPGALSYFGNDFVSGFRRNRSTAQAFDLMNGVDDPTFDAVSALASLNARRQDQMLRAVIIGYLTIPLSIVAILAEVAGAGLVGYVRENLESTIQVGLIAASAPLIFFMSHWRSRQILSVLDLIRIERGQAPFTALELREE